MPCYHFRIKSDKKKGGGRVSAAEHSRYIEREGKYADYDEKELERLQYNNVITGDSPIEHLPNRELILYTSPFGCIKQDETGIRVSSGASVETVAIALTVARYIYGNDNLFVSGSKRFQGSVVTAADEMNLPISFQDENLEGALQDRREKKEDERREFERNGGRVRQRHINYRPRGSDADERVSEPGAERRTLKALTEEGLRLPALSERHLVHDAGKPALLLQPDEMRDMLNRFRRRALDVRWDAGPERRMIVERTAQDIMVNVQRESDTVFASSHVQYINRESAFKQRGGCLYKGHHLPKWAQENPKVFFDAADRFERRNGERYKEIEFALPSELNLEEQKKIVEQFLEHHLKNFYYAFAIHDKIGAMSDGEHHPHVHIMFSTREMDDVERKHERPPELFFKRYNKHHPERGGCGKALKWFDRKFQSANLMQMREDYAAITNAVLKKNGISLRVDHRSLKARREEALANGNLFLAQLLNRVPESSVGPVALLEKNNAEVRQQRALRKLNQRKEKNLILQGILQDEVDENEVRHHFEDLPIWLSDIKEALPSIEDTEERTRLGKEWDKITRQVERSVVKNQAIAWSKNVMEEAKLSAMTLPEREIWQRLKTNGRELQDWKDFLLRWKPPAPVNKEERDEQDAVRSETQRRIHELEQNLKDDAATLHPVFERLRQPSTKKAIYEQIAMKLSEGFTSKKNLRLELHEENASLEKLDAAVRRALIRQNEDTTYTAPEIAEALKGSIEEKEARLKELQRELKELGHHVYSQARALEMAKDNYLKGAWSEWKLDKRKLDKLEKKRPGQNMEALDWLNARKVNLEKRCSTPEAQAKIHDVASGILRKNIGNQKAYQKLSEQVKMLKMEIQKEKRQEAAVEFSSAPNGTRYRTIYSQNQQGAGQQGTMHGGHGGGGGMTFPTPDYNMHRIAQVLSRDDDTGMVGLVITSKPDAPDDWYLLSETEKEDRKNDLANLDRL